MHSRKKIKKVINLIKAHAYTDIQACKEAGVSKFDFWKGRKEYPDLAEEYQQANDYRAQYYLEQASEYLQQADDRIMNGECDIRAASAIVNLARNRYACNLKYAALTDKKRWGESKTEVHVHAGDRDPDIDAAVEMGKKIRGDE